MPTSHEWRRGAVLAVALLMAGATPAAASPDTLLVGPGTIGTMRMGVPLARAEQRGWVAPAVLCVGWTAGPKAVRTDRFGDVYKAFPGEVKAQKLLSMWATGQVVTVRGIRTNGLGSRAQLGSSVISLREAYPGLRRLGRIVEAGRRVAVYSVLGPKGHLDFHVVNGRVGSVVVRTAAVDWKRAPVGGC